MQSLKAIRAALPLSCPLPPSLNAIPTSDLNLEHELARNPTNLSRWFSYIKHIKEDLVKITLNERGTETVTPIEKQVLGKKLSNPSSRLGFQRLCSVYERALLHFPVSYKLWNSYLTWRREYVTGTVEKAQRVKLNAPKPRVDLAENEKLYGLLKADRDGTVTLAERDWDGNVVDPKWEGSLDGLIGLEEWQSLAGTYERALTCMPMVRLLHPSLAEANMIIDASVLDFLPITLLPSFLPCISISLARSKNVRSLSSYATQISPSAHMATLPKLERQRRLVHTYHRMATLPQSRPFPYRILHYPSSAR